MRKCQHDQPFYGRVGFRWRPLEFLGPLWGEPGEGGHKPHMPSLPLKGGANMFCDFLRGNVFSTLAHHTFSNLTFGWPTAPEVCQNALTGLDAYLPCDILSQSAGAGPSCVRFSVL